MSIRLSECCIRDPEQPEYNLRKSTPNGTFSHSLVLFSLTRTGNFSFAVTSREIISQILIFTFFSLPLGWLSPKSANSSRFSANLKSGVFLFRDSLVSKTFFFFCFPCLRNAANCEEMLIIVTFYSAKKPLSENISHRDCNYFERAR